MQLRDYQTDTLNAVRKSYRDGHKRPCIVAPCGYGKTVLAAQMAAGATAKGNRVLFLVHRQELVDQTVKTFLAAGVDMSLCNIGMVQTVTRRIGQIPEPQLIITDENHHAKAASYRRIYDAYPNAKCVGITATPQRLDGSGLADVNDDLVVGAGAKWLIANSYLAPYDYYAPAVADLTGLKSSRGEYIVSDIEQRMIKRAVFGDVIANYRKLAGDRQAICYCASIRHSEVMAQEFNAAGIPSAHIDGDTPTAERAETIEQFRQGSIKILCNVDLISEGFDVPDCACSILLRPTKSLTLHIQQSMRCMRYKDGKRAVIIDHVGNYARHGLPDDERSWTLEGKRKKTGTREASQIAVRQCPECYYVHPIAEKHCPQCGYVYSVKDRTPEEIKEARLEKITSIVIQYDTPDNCRTYEELRAYGKKKGYKPGWAYIQAKQKGLL